MSQIGEYYAAGKQWSWHWGNCLYLEWFSQANGRVVIESTAYRLTIEGEPAWEMTAEGTVANFATVQIEAEREVAREVEILQSGRDHLGGLPGEVAAGNAVSDLGYPDVARVYPEGVRAGRRAVEKRKPVF